MYENENVNQGTEGSTAENQHVGSSSTSYFDYTKYPARDMNGYSNAETVKEAPKKQKKQAGGLRKAAFSAGLGLCFGLFAGAGFYAVKLGADRFAQTNTQNLMVDTTPQVNTNQDSLLTQVNNVTFVTADGADVAESVMPAMVSISINYMTTSTSIWGQTYSREASATGSGIIVGESEDEYLIVTNNHVVESADELQVSFIDGSTANASIKGLDPDMDLAVIAVKRDELSDETLAAITVATLGDSDNLRLGEPVFAIGNALGYGQSFTGGYISAINREITLENGAKGTFIQTDAAINPGNSGGALLNVRGEVIGINSNKIAGMTSDGATIEGMGYAIPISSASPIIKNLMEYQAKNKVSEEEKGYMGITMQEISEQAIRMYNMPQGVFVYDIERGFPAQKAGIHKGDIIVKLDGFTITSISDIQNAMQYFAAGDTATITVKRAVNGEYETLDFEVTFGERPQNR